jgi:hypothetical protein
MTTVLSCNLFHSLNGKTAPMSIVFMGDVFKGAVLKGVMSKDVVGCLSR